MVRNLIGRADATSIVIITILIVLAINLGSYLILYFGHGLNIFDETEYADFTKKFVKRFDRATFPHPYLGLISFSDEVYRSELSDEHLFSWVYKSSAPNEVKVLLLGGSVAAGLSDLLAKKMNARFNTHRFSLYSAAQQGYKQPQQYLKLVYLDLLGFRPDIVINYDGFNEIAIPVSENRSLHDPAIFPRSNSRHLASILNRSCVELNNRLLNWHSRIPVVALVTFIFAQKCDYKVNKYDWPWWTYMFDTAGTDDDYGIRSAAIWRESSNRIYEFTKMHSVDYIEVIQPDQHFPNSKIWSQDEQRVNDLPVNPYANAIKKYYKLLSRDGLMAANFLDQRYLFRDNSETLYIDFCCHLNQRGNELVIDDILNNFQDLFVKHLGPQSSTSAQ